MFSDKWLIMLLQFLIFVPGTLSCYLTVKNQMRFSERKTLALGCLTAALFAFTAASAVTVGNVSSNAVGLLILIISFFLYRCTVRLDMSCALAIYVGSAQ